MNGQIVDAALNSPAPPPVIAPPVAGSQSVGALGKLRKIGVGVWKYFAGATQCVTLVGSIVIVGWTYRLVRRAVLKQWWKRSALRSGGVRFETFLDGSDETRDLKRWPNWFVQQNAREKFRMPGVRAKLKALGYSLWLNLKTGTQGIFNTWVLKMPGCVLMLFAW